MRIIAGQRRGHKIDGPTNRDTRPTSELVRESLFNLLGAEVDGRLVVDLFAGTGALGLEALSRGALRTIFVEKHRANVALIHRNVERLRYEDRATVLPTDVFRWAHSFQPVNEEPMMILIDPPYREFENHPGRVTRLLELLCAKLPAGSAVALEMSSDVTGEVITDPENWDLRRYGGTQIAIRWLEQP